jgi:hypothetical protein
MASQGTGCNLAEHGRVYNIESKQVSGTYLSVENAAMADFFGARVHLWGDPDRPNTQWRFLRLWSAPEPNTYKLEAKHARGKFLCSVDGSDVYISDTNVTNAGFSCCWQLERLGPCLHVKWIMVDGTSKYLTAAWGGVLLLQSERPTSSHWSLSLARVLEMSPHGRSFDVDGLRVAEWKYAGERVLVVECTDKQHPLVQGAVAVLIMEHVLRCSKNDIYKFSLSVPAALDIKDSTNYDLATVLIGPHNGLRAVGVGTNKTQRLRACCLALALEVGIKFGCE